MREPPVVIVGAGIAGLAAAMTLAASGLPVVLLEKAARPGGKMREIEVGGCPIDSGPTVLTMRPVFDALFDRCGLSLDEFVALRPAETLARHSWTGGASLDLFADLDRSADAIGAFAGAREAAGFRAFSARAERVYGTLAPVFIEAARPSLADLVMRVGLRRFGDLRSISPFTTLWRALGEHFSDPRLRQLFGRYATYCGSSPFLAPATLMLVAHVERSGVWLVDGGMQRLADGLARAAERKGAELRYGAEVASVGVEGGRTRSVLLSTGERIDARAVLLNADVAALAGGVFGRDVARAAPAIPRAARSLSALTWSLVAGTGGAPLQRHNVFFSDDYPAEFDAIRRGRPPLDPTVYVCAEDRGSEDGVASDVPERLFCIVNAPARGDTDPLSASEIRQCEERTFGRLERCGLSVRRQPGSSVVTTPSDFARLFPGTGGALYGRASHGWMASFQRPGARSRIPGLYLAGGSTHPGPGVPMAALSGKLAAAALLADLASTSRSVRVATPGGMSTRSATTAGTG